MNIGALIVIRNGGTEIMEKFKSLGEMGLHYCQLSWWNHEIMTDENTEAVKEASKKYGVEVTAFWCGYSGECRWNFTEGPHTIGIVPERYREIRVRELKNGADFAKKIGVRDVITHLGFIPEVPTTTEYFQLVCAVKDIAEYMLENKQRFLFETGQETPITLKRLIEDVGTGNCGINLDPANLILYGKANPVDAVSVFGEYVYNTHIKDGVYPVDGRELGKETVVGEGMVNYPLLVKALKDCNYSGPYIIEREVDGDEWYDGVKQAIELLNKIDKETSEK